MLTLPIMGKWFNMILSGEKGEEYREIKPYYMTRFKKIFEMHTYQQERTLRKSVLETDTAAVDPSL